MAWGLKYGYSVCWWSHVTLAYNPLITSPFFGNKSLEILMFLIGLIHTSSVWFWKNKCVHKTNLCRKISVLFWYFSSVIIRLEYSEFGRVLSFLLFFFFFFWANRQSRKKPAKHDQPFSELCNTFWVIDSSKL